MPYKQLVSPKTDATDQAGWCLSMQQKVWKCATKWDHATDAYFKGTKFRHETRDLPNAAVIVWFKWVNNVRGDKNFGVDQGHVVAYIPGRGFLSSPGSGHGQKWFGSIGEVERYFGCTFRGWTEDINGTRVVEYIEEPKPVTAPQPATTGQGGDYTTVVELAGYVNSSDAANRQNSNSRVPAGNYKIFNETGGLVNITNDVNQPGWWINPADNVAPAPQPQAPAAPAFSVGDTVAPNSQQTKSFENVDIYAWHPRYSLVELNGDRAVLAVDGTIWSSIRVSDIHKV